MFALFALLGLNTAAFFAVALPDSAGACGFTSKELGYGKTLGAVSKVGSCVGAALFLGFGLTALRAIVAAPQSQDCE